MTEDRVAFQAEVSRLLDIVANALYSDREVFLRELISNASDACDKLRYLALTDPSLTAEDPSFRIRLIPDKSAGTLTIADNGIGMNREDLVSNLGTIARSGTGAFLESVRGQTSAPALIGQFGVGFYSSFMVATTVTVLSRKAGEVQGWRWSSDGKGTYVIAAEDGVPRGTQVILTLKPDCQDYLEEPRLSHVVEKYSDHIDLPIELQLEDGSPKVLNRAAALWTRPKQEITADQYKEFYHHVAHVFDEPWLTLHNKVEGAVEYTNLLFVPSTRPFDLFDPRRRNYVKLYVRKVFITDDIDELLPPYLRFVRGVVDCADLPLNISREMLQTNPTVTKIRNGLVKRILAELDRAGKDLERYTKFWETFGAVVKEGLYDDFQNQQALLKICRFHSTQSPGLVSLEDYVARMVEGQQAIYVLHGDDLATMRSSPHLEGFKAKGVEVLLLTDSIDEFWLTSVSEHQGKPFRSVTRFGADLKGLKARPGEAEAGAEAADRTTPEAPEIEAGDERAIATLIGTARLVLGQKVKDVRLSAVLTDSAVRLSADEGDVDMHLARLLRQHNRMEQVQKRVLEVNPRHPLIRKLAYRLAASGEDGLARDLVHLLLDQALIVEGEALSDPAGFARRLVIAAEQALT